MKFQTFLSKVYQPSSSRTRRSSDFQPLSLFDNAVSDQQSSSSSSVNPPASQSHVKVFGSNFRAPDLTNFPNVQPPIELKNLKDHQESREKSKTSPVKTHSAQTTLVEPRDRSGGETQVYNPPSEDLPPDICGEDGFASSFLNTKLSLGNIGTGGDGEDGNHDEECTNNPVYIQKGRWGCPGCDFVVEQFRRRTRLARIIFFVCSISAFLGLTVLTGIGLKWLISLGEPDSVSDYDVLMNHSWPLHDVKSRAKNISFDAVTKEHAKLKSIDESAEDFPIHVNEKKLLLKTNEYRSVDIGNLKLNGKNVDSKILAASYESARQIFHEMVGKNSSRDQRVALKGLVCTIVIEDVKRRLSISDTKKSMLQGSLPEDLCFSQSKEMDISTCKTKKRSWYRQITGQCNNVLYPNQGSLYSPLRRIIATKSMYGNLNLTHKARPKLPDVRYGQIEENGTTSEENNNNHGATALLPLWGLLIIHDTLKVASAPGKCCEIDNHIPMTYPVETKRNVTISNTNFFVDTLGICYDHKVEGQNQTMKKGTKLGNDQCPSIPPPAIYPACDVSEPRSPYNLVTSHIDASNIYGSSLEATDKLREKKNGLLKIQKGRHHRIGLGFLPKEKARNDSTCYYGSPINAKVPNNKCLLSGDPDINENALITALNTILVRQHNTIAFWLRMYNHNWDDERLFQESRKILIAQVQHITFNEFLPNLLGVDLTEAGNVTLEEDDKFYDLYNPEVDSTPSTAFAAASKLIFYLMLGPTAKMIYKEGKFEQPYLFNIGRLWYHPEIVVREKGKLESLIRGSVWQSISYVGLNFSRNLRAVHIKFANKTLDLAGLFFEQGQSLELPSYNELRKACGLKELKSFEDFNETWDPVAMNITAGTPKLEEVDLLTGILAEKPIPYGKVGPTMACILMDQFMRFKRGDRYWYEGEIYFHHFTPEQLKTIRETTLSRIICDNTEDVLERIQKWPMLLPNLSYNPVLSCTDSRIPKFKYELWKELAHSKVVKGRLNGTDEYEDDYDMRAYLYLQDADADALRK